MGKEATRVRRRERQRTLRPVLRTVNSSFNLQRAACRLLRLLGDVFGRELLAGIGGDARTLEAHRSPDDQAMVLPCASVMVMARVLNDEFTCATPDAMFLRSTAAVTRVASLPIPEPFLAISTPP